MNIRKLSLSLTAALAAVYAAHADPVTEPLPDHSDWGYKITGLGDKGDETALVFTNTTDTMNWTLESGVQSVWYLVVGGGGAGGACAASSYTSGGGGGAGAALTNTVSTSGGELLTITVGTGGTGCTRSSNNLVAPRMEKGNGGSSSLTIGATDPITALGGGFGGCNGNSGSNADKIVGSGGCGGGGCGNRAAGTGSTGGNRGGGSVKLATSVYPGGGGGGAGAPGGDCYYDGNSKKRGGVGGDGIESNITGESLWYAGGGGAGAGQSGVSGGAGGKGGGGNGGTSGSTLGTSATYYGGGGGGTYNNFTQGAYSSSGYQGIVIVRYRVMAANAVAVPTVEPKEYTGETLTGDVPEGELYHVAINAGGIEAGDYECVVELNDPENYVWDGGSKDPTNIVFRILPTDDSWITPPSLTKTTWEFDEEAAEVNPGVARSGTEVVVSYDDGLAEMPTSVGAHTAKFAVAPSRNFNGMTNTINYTVTKNTNAWVVEPTMTKTTWAFNETPGEISDGTPKYGELVVAYDDDPEHQGIQTAIGDYYVTFTVAEGDTYTALSKKINYSVTKKQHQWTVAPSVPATVNIEDGISFPMPAAEQGVEVKVYFDGDPEKTELTEIAFGETHTVTYAIAGDDEWDEVKQTFSFKGVYKEITDRADPSKVYGYRIPKLGANQDEVALVFTNTSYTVDNPMTWKLAQEVTAIDYLVVGGGGAGGTSRDNHGAGGGGAGGVVTETAIPFAGSVISVVVGSGGAKGTTTAAVGKDGEDSSLAFDATTIVAKKGGGGGYRSAGRGGDGYACGGGAGNSAAGTKDFFYAGGTGEISSGAGVTSLGSNGGGGGGAGGDATSVVGGTGVAVTIFGHNGDYYIAGGGSGTATSWSQSEGSVGGGGFGNRAGSAYGTKKDAGDGSEWGAGGGGACGGYPVGGAGHQGVVVVRYVEPAGVVMAPEIAPKTYTGETQTADIADGVGYTVTKNDGGTDVGSYDVILTLNEGFHWDGGSTDPTNLVFTITQAQNEWTVEPGISKASWLTTDEPGVLTSGVTKFGEVSLVISKDGAEAVPFESLPTAAGVYVITNIAPATTDNYLAPEVTEKTVEFTIFAADATPDFTVALDGDIQVGFADGSITAAIPYKVSCEVVSPKTVTIYALIAGEGSDTTSRVAIAENVPLDGAGYGVLSDPMPGQAYWISICGQGGDTCSNTTMPVRVEVLGPATGLSASATFTNDPKEFVISGSVTPGLGTTTVYLRWSLNSDALDQSAAFPFSYGDAGAFTQKVAYAELADKLTWDVVVSNSYTSTTHGEQTWDASLPVKTKDRFDSAAVTYTWTGNGGDNRWLNIANWSANKTENFGYPDSGNATAKFEKSWAIDLCGGTFELAKGTGLTVGTYDYMVFSNGTIHVDSAKDADFGAANTTVVFKDATLERDRLSPVANATVVFEGAARFTGMVRPWGASGEKMNFLNGENITIGKILCGGTATGREMTISNATVTLQGTMAAAYGSATFPVTLQNGPDRQARLVSSHADGWDFVQSPYTLTIPEQPYAAPYFQSTKARGSVNSSPTFNIDVTNWKRGKRVPILTFTSSASGAAATQYGNATVKAYENGVDVTAKRNAQLIWDDASNTLYYKQNGGGLLLFMR